MTPDSQDESGETTLAKYAERAGVDFDDGGDDDGDGGRRYICTSCDSVVRARWYSSGSFAVGCDCTTVPVVPQMGQAETPNSWRVEREDCCADVDVKDLEPSYGDRHVDYECPHCGALYSWDGEMAGPPDNEGETA